VHGALAGVWTDTEFNIPHRCNCCSTFRCPSKFNAINALVQGSDVPSAYQDIYDFYWHMAEFWPEDLPAAANDS